MRQQPATVVHELLPAFRGADPYLDSLGTFLSLRSPLHAGLNDRNPRHSGGGFRVLLE